MNTNRWYLGKRSTNIAHFAVGMCITILTAVVLTLTRSGPVLSSQAPTGLAAPLSSGALLSAPVTTAAGQSATLLPDGRWLLIGGPAHPGLLQLFDPISQLTEDLPAQLVVPRSNHAATLLPDGTVLILGGVGPDGRVLNSAEQYNPMSANLTTLGAVELEPRAFQTATVLPDGRVLIVGGTGADSQPLVDAQILEPSGRAVETLPAVLDVGRLQPLVTLTSGGSELIWGGTDALGRAQSNGILLDPVAESVTSANSQMVFDMAASLTSAAVPGVTYRQPTSDAKDFSVGASLVVAFDKPMAVASLNTDTVTLVGPNGVAPAKATPVENGLLLFITPGQDLTPAANYTLFISGAHARSGQSLPFTAMGFATPKLDPTAAGDAAALSKSDISINGASPPNTAPPTVTLVPATGAVSASSPSSTNRATPKGSTSAKPKPPHPSTVPATKFGAKVVTQAPTMPSGDGERWIPTADNYHGRWVSTNQKLARQSMPKNDLLKRAIYGNPEVIAVMNKLTPASVAAGKMKNLVPTDRLLGPPGITAVTGQVLKLNGQPLRDATLSIGTTMVRSDSQGEFTLFNVPAGHQILVIDGDTSSGASHQYGRYEYGMNVIAGQTNALPFVSWMTALDTKDAMTIASPTSRNTVLTNPEIPGLELRIPAGTVIRDAVGKIVTTISMTAIPTDQPPFPLPSGFHVPVYFTIQPGGAHLESSPGQVNQGAQLIYPNFTNSPPGTRMIFWNYDANSKGWYVYGQGTVTADGTQVMPDPGVVIYEFSGAMVSLQSNAPPPPSDQCKHGDPVDCFTGLFINDEVDLKIQDVIPIEIRRTYRPQDNVSRAFGIGTNLGYDLFNVGDTSSYSYQELILPDGARVTYPRVSQGTSYGDAVYRSTSTPGPFYGSILSYEYLTESYNSTWSLILKDGTSFYFPDSYALSNARSAAVMAIADRVGNAIQLTRDSNSNLTQITSPNGRHLNLIYDSSNRVTQVTDDIGRIVRYSYDAAGRLVQVTDPAGKTEKYTYDSNNNMLTVTDKLGNVKVTNTYNASNRVTAQIYADKTTSSFAYTAGQTNFTDQRGTVTQMVFNSSGYPTQVTSGLKTSQQQVFVYNRDPNTNLVNGTTDALGRVNTYVYDPLGNMTQMTRLAGTQNAVSTYVAYGTPFSEPTQITDPNNNSMQFGYDGAGNLLSITDPLMHVTQFTYDAEGRALTVMDANDNTTGFTYYEADLSSVTDAIGRHTVFGRDSVGRLISATNPLGAQSTNTFDLLNRLTATIDANGSKIQYGLDANGNLLTLTDANSHATSYSYDSLNRVLSMTDPLSNVDSDVYEPGGFISRYTDRKGQVRGWTYDALGRPTQVGFGGTAKKPTTYTSTIGLTWDAGDRLTKIVDSVSGTITRTYDGLDRVTQETTSQGVVNYTYDAGDRRTSMTVQSQPAINYTWDSANRLVKLQQSAGSMNGNVAQNITFAYDNANRRTQVGMSNGIMATYSYDSANQLLEIAYAQSGGTSVGTLTYTYDAAGRRISAGGTLANVTTPPSAVTNVFDANNRLTKLNTTSLSYDSNGNTTSDGTNTFTWDARDQLSSLAGPVAGSFKYDALGRRIQKTIGSATTGFLYDGANFIQEQNSTGAATATLLTGHDDELFARMTSTGNSTQLTDALGSVVAETNTAQTVTTNYSYEPYGKTTVAGTSTGDSQQFTARESDGTGIYYYRARYYSPNSARFISEDPIRFYGGPNVYAYAQGNPVSTSDPLGLKPGDAFPTAEAAALDALNYINGLADCGTNEYSNFVYQNWALFGGEKTFTYDEPVEISPMGGTLQPPQWHTLGAIFHNHPPVPNADSYHYSPQDEDTADRLNIPSYLETPGGNILRYTPVPQDPRRGNVAAIGKTSATCTCQGR